VAQSAPSEDGSAERQAAAKGATSTKSEQGPGERATLDAGRLDPTWFGEGLEFREASGIDYLWVRPAFDLDGKKLRFVPFGEVQLLGEKASKRKEKVRQRAEAVNPVLHEHLADRFRDAFDERISIVAEGEDIRVEGRVADCAGGFTSITMVGVIPVDMSHYVPLTVDIKLVDGSTGELLAAIHHRAVEDDWDDWLEDMVEHVAEKGLLKLYAKGRRATK
jgi:hypothetical protein